MKNKQFVIARYWNDDTNQLCIYAYGTQVQYGDEDHAEHFLNYVKEQKPEFADQYQIFWLNTDRDDLETSEEIREKLEKEYLTSHKEDINHG